MMRSRIAERRSSVCSLSELAGPDKVKVVVGADRRDFFIPRKLLASCDFFREQIDCAPLELSNGQPHLVIRLEGQCPDMFGLFSYWLEERRGFARFIDEAEVENTCDELHWDLVNLHLFAAQVDLPTLQDLAMDSIQDLYLRCNWEINPKLVSYVFTECGPEESCRLRKWIVAMIAWTLGGIGSARLADRIRLLLEYCLDLQQEYRAHHRGMAKSRLESRFKNPQLRLPSNILRSEERQFGFRQCTFHTHRSTVGQGKCPHMYSLSLSSMPPSPSTDGFVDSDSDQSEIRFGSRMVSPCSDTIFESDMEEMF
ncbi:hypothetical protein F5Y15DRAFT_416007 [Xylariaceae sp. FL0016]|nr:hypothetical protein F5Y15DRAFT_416007 [Xylariaceae sp. FL0016]